MRVHLLGTAAGGGFPQWNCKCLRCQAVRAGAAPARRRRQSCAAISADGSSWFLLNASPDLREQIESFPPLLPSDGVRGTGIEGVLLTSADLDHTLGLFLMREGQSVGVHATPAVRRALSDGLALERVLACYCGVNWVEPPGELAPLCGRDGTPSGLDYAAFPIRGKPPRYLGAGVRPGLGDNVGYRVVDPGTGGRLLYLPGVSMLDAAAMAELRDCDALLLDGTFWSEEELRDVGAGTATASEMGHLPVGGPGGSLARIAKLPIARKVYTHINNTNPMLIEDSPEHRAVDAAGVVVGWDGLDFRV
jgi:pyrroloquinoline quinone biosynthesis protein B